MDEVDLASERQEKIDALALKAAAQNAKEIEQGHAGFCDACGDENGRLMGASYFIKKRRDDVAALISEGNGICSRCRDKNKLP